MSESEGVSRDDALAEVRASLADTQVAMQAVADALANLVPRGDMDRATEAAKQDNDRWRKSVVLLILGGPLLVALTLGLGWKADHDRARQVRILSNGVKCLLADLDDHRHTNQAAHDTLAEKHGFGKIIQPDVIPLTKEQADRLKQSCETYVQGAVGGAQPGLKSDATAAEGDPHG